MRVVLIFILFPLCAFPQEREGLLGVKYNLLQFQKNDPFGRVRDMNAGFGVQIINPLKGRFDYLLAADIAFADSAGPLKIQEKRLLLSADISLRARMFASRAPVQPFLSAGAGMLAYRGYLSAFFPTGAGVEIRLFKGAYCLVQAQYRFVTPSSINSHYLFSAGVYGVINTKRSKRQQTKANASPVITFTARDSDYDGIPDSLDACPDMAGSALFAGCPDSDNDGIPNKEDRCPFLFGFVDYGGCPIPDTDGDGWNDQQDSCINAAGIAAFKGCPAPDSDSDGVWDTDDSCVTVFGDARSNGCPVNDTAMDPQLREIARHILFESGRSVLTLSSLTYLEQVKEIMIKNKNLRLMVEGHTDNTNTASFNMELSKRRAWAVVNYLLKNGIDSSRLGFRGWGMDKPIDSNNTKEGRARNRRVELHVLDKLF